MHSRLDKLNLLYNHMVMNMSELAASESSLNAIFAALADPTRRAILSKLADGEASVNELTAPFDMSQPAISKHLKVLERAGLISRHAKEQRRLAQLQAEQMATAVEWLENFRVFWETSFGQLDQLLLSMKNDKSKE